MHCAVQEHLILSSVYSESLQDFHIVYQSHVLGGSTDILLLLLREVNLNEREGEWMGAEVLPDLLITLAGPYSIGTVALVHRHCFQRAV